MALLRVYMDANAAAMEAQLVGHKMDMHTPTGFLLPNPDGYTYRLIDPELVAVYVTGELDQLKVVAADAPEARVVLAIGIMRSMGD